MVNTHWPLILLPVFGSQGIIATFLMRQFFAALPVELEEAAKLDGLRPLRHLLAHRSAVVETGSGGGGHHFLPALPGTCCWNPLVFLSDLEKFTVPLALTNFSDAYGPAAVAFAAGGDVAVGYSGPAGVQSLPNDRSSKVSRLSGR